MLINANALAIPLANKCVHTIVTSPPYYGLRDYGVNGQIGLEVTPDAYIANLVEVFRECKRILRDDGTLWVNVGDSYNGNTPNQSGQNGYNDGRENRDKRYSTGGIDGLKPKDLIGIPWMLAFALRADGWYLRQDIIWAKPNPMPESVKDRCTKSHEYIFLLSKSAKYYYDNEAVKEPATDRPVDSWEKRKAGGAGSGTLENGHNSSLAKGAGYSHTVGNGITRNKRDVWTVTTKPYKGAHYATFNPDLIKPCILAGAPEGGIVFDPFVGSGTTVATAIQLGRKGIGLDLSYKYLQENAKVRVEAAELPLLNLIDQY
jgi:DNA modification methylase